MVYGLKASSWDPLKYKESQLYIKPPSALLEYVALMHTTATAGISYAIELQKRLRISCIFLTLTKMLIKWAKNPKMAVKMSKISENHCRGLIWALIIQWFLRLGINFKDHNLNFGTDLTTLHTLSLIWRSKTWLPNSKWPSFYLNWIKFMKISLTEIIW